MCCERLVCANCAGFVSEGRCSVCRAGRELLHQESGRLSPVLLMALMVLAAAVLLIAIPAARGRAPGCRAGCLVPPSFRRRY
jgi:hypothetical protein